MGDETGTWRSVDLLRKAIRERRVSVEGLAGGEAHFSDPPMFSISLLRLARRVACRRSMNSILQAGHSSIRRPHSSCGGRAIDGCHVGGANSSCSGAVGPWSSRFNQKERRMQEGRRRRQTRGHGIISGVWMTWRCTYVAGMIHRMGRWWRRRVDGGFSWGRSSDSGHLGWIWMWIGRQRWWAHLPNLVHMLESASRAYLLFGREGGCRKIVR